MIALTTGCAAWAADILVDDFSSGSMSLQGRIFDSRLDADGWDKPHGWSGNGNVDSNWEISGGTLNNATADAATNYIAGEAPVSKWWTNPEPTSTKTRLRISFDYGVGAGDTLTCHFWAVQAGGTPTTTFAWISNNQAWQNGNSGGNETCSTNGYAPFSLLNGANPPGATGYIGGALTGTNTLALEIDVSTLGIPGVSAVGDIDTFCIAFAGDENGGGTTWVDDLSIIDWETEGILEDDFDFGSTPPDEGRVWESRLDSGWQATWGYGATNYPSLWDITGGKLENPANVDPTGIGSRYTESECPVWQWWTNPEPASSRAGLQLSLDYGVGAGDTLTVHLWAVQEVDVAVTGATTIDAVNPNQLTRASGSFLSDGFVVGHEIRLTAGFASNPNDKTYTITAISGDGATITVNANGTTLPFLVTEAGTGDEEVDCVGPGWITNNQGWINGNSGQNQDKSLNYDTFNLLDGDTTPDGADHISGALTGTNTFEWTLYLNNISIPGVATVGDIDTFFIAFAANETGGGTTWIDNVSFIGIPRKGMTLVVR
jgi:hypothetical protein